MLTFDEQNHIYRVQGVAIPSVTQILVAEGFIDTSWFTEYGRDRGKYAHEAIKLYEQGSLDEESLDPVLRPYLDAWKQFKTDTGYVSEVVEEPLYSPVYQYAGTPDNIGLLNGEPTVLDIKTGAISPWVALQLSAYETLKKMCLDRVALRLMPDGKYRLRHFKDRTDRQVFLAAVATFYWRKNNGLLRP